MKNPSRAVPRSLSVLLPAVFAALAATPAQALILPFPSSIPQEVLSEAVPTAFAPNDDLKAADFAVEWEGAPIPGMKATLGRDSLEWVRVAEVLVLPRGRLLLAADDVEGGRITQAGFSEALDMNKGHATVEVPVAFFSGKGSEIDVSVRRGGRDVTGRLRVRFRPRDAANDGRVYLDPSCSRFGVSVQSVFAAEGARPREWGYVGCRQVIVEGDEHRAMNLEMYVFWDGVGESIRVGGVETPSSGSSVWPMRLHSRAEPVVLRSNEGHGLAVRYQIPEHMHLGNLGLGLGPYQNVFRDPSGESADFAPTITLYGSYFLTEALRIVAFDATAAGKHGNTDFGVYLNSENLRVIDRRLAVNIMLGAHVIGFQYKDQFHFLPGLPQGFEIIYTDAFKPGYNLSTGGFFYPNINGEAYYNAWLRWGGRIFFEVNYIAWDEVVQGDPLHNQTVGVSVGFPLARFL